ncbi:MAG: M67 family metallopeptidase [Chloroflexota bacterium]
MIQIARAVYDEMIAHALETRPFECCGVLAGSGGIVTQGFRAENVADLNGVRYEVDPKAFLRINREIDDADLELLGIYHSHPFTRAYPSATDLAQAWEGLVYVIVSLTDFLAPDVKAFTVVNGEITEQTVEVGA